MTKDQLAEIDSNLEKRNENYQSSPSQRSLNRDYEFKESNLSYFNRSMYRNCAALLFMKNGISVHFLYLNLILKKMFF